MKILLIILLTGVALFTLIYSLHIWHCCKADLRTWWRSILSKYKRAGLPPAGTMFLFVAVVSLYLIGTAIF